MSPNRVSVSKTSCWSECAKIQTHSHFCSSGEFGVDLSCFLSGKRVLADVSPALAKETSDSRAELQGFSFFLHQVSAIVLTTDSYAKRHGNRVGRHRLYFPRRLYEARRRKTPQQDTVFRFQHSVAGSSYPLCVCHHHCY